MRIGIMLRHLDQHGGGVLVYTHRLLQELARLDSDHEFVLLVRDPSGLAADLPRERFRIVRVGTPTRFLWDQVGIQRAARREGLDMIFNPKYSLPLAFRGPSVFVCHGLDWYAMPHGSRRQDRLNHRILIPRYAQKADAVICVSESTRHHMIEYLNVPEDRLHTVYLGVGDAFRQEVPPEQREKVRKKYGLPERFFMYCGQIYPPKNFGRLLRAFARVVPELQIPLVAVGTHTWLCEDEIALIDKLGIEKHVVWPGWIDHGELPAFYAQAEALLMPSLYEACPLPILEAMASGCPVVTANRHGTAELAGGAAVLVDPDSVHSIADGIRQVAGAPELRSRLVDAGRERAQPFTWERCAAQTLRVLEKVGSGG